MTIRLSRSRLLELIERFHNLRIGIIGDFTLDGYWHADMARSELSRETPRFPRPIIQERYSLGGAANTAWNLADLGVREACAFSVLGDDWRGTLLRGLLAAEGINTQGLFNQADRVTPFYGKVVLEASGRPAQEDSRMDFVNTNPVAPETEAALLERLSAQFSSLDALIVADYQEQGVLTPRLIKGLLALAKAHPQIPVVVDSRSRAAAFRSLILKPNAIEAAKLFFPDLDPASVSLEALTRAASAHQAGSARPIFITLGAEGCLACFDGHCELVPGVPVGEPVDPVGAGDSFISALAAALSSGGEPVEAACFANLAASVTVKKLGITGTASPEELVQQHDLWVEMEHL